MGNKNRVKKKPKPKPKPRRKRKVRNDWETNNDRISNAFYSLAIRLGKVPSMRLIAEETKLSEKTVERHFETIEFSKLKQKFRACTDKVMLKLVAKALKMDSFPFTRLYFEVVEDLGMKKQVDVTSGGQTIKQSPTLEKLSFEQLEKLVEAGDNKSS